MSLDDNEGRNVLDIQHFLESCLDAAQICNVDPALKERMIADLVERLNRWVFADLMKALDDEAGTELDELMSAGGDEGTIMAFLRRRVPRFDMVVANSFESFRKTFAER
jgi:hypothetical protein